MLITSALTYTTTITNLANHMQKYKTSEHKLHKSVDWNAFKYHSFCMVGFLVTKEFGTLNLIEHFHAKEESSVHLFSNSQLVCYVTEFI